MRFVIKHELKGRLRIHAVQRRMTCSEADTLSWFLEKQENITSVKVYERTADAVICYTGEKEDLIMLLKQFRYSRVEVPENISASSGRRLNTEYKEKLITKVILHYSSKLFLPYPVRGGVHGPEIGEIYLGRDPVPATGENRSAGTGCCGDRSVCPSGDINTAGSVMFLLGVGEILEEWTHKKSVGDLARSMSLNIKKSMDGEGGAGDPGKDIGDQEGRHCCDPHGKCDPL